MTGYTILAGFLIFFLFFIYLTWFGYSIKIENDKNNESVFKITSPVSDDHSELRYGIFTYNPGKEESISGGIKSWAGK